MPHSSAPPHNPYAVGPRKPLSPKQKLQMFLDAGGICCVCGLPIDSAKEAWDEHENPLWLNGDNSAPNRAPAHAKCARQKTAVEARLRAKIRRTAEKHMGARKRSTMPGSRASKWKRKMNGRTVLRDEED